MGKDMDESTSGRISLSKSPETIAAMIAHRCQSDAPFDLEFREDPQDTIQQAFETKSSPQQLHLHGNDDNNWHIVLPDLEVRERINRVLTSERPLSDDEIGSIAGGEAGAFTVFFALFASTYFLSALGVVVILGGALAAGITVGLAKDFEKKTKA